MDTHSDGTDLTCDGVAAHLLAAERKGDHGILLLPSLHGREPYIIDYMRTLAAAGYPVLLWDLFRGKGEVPTREARAARSASLSDAGAFREMTTLLGFMQRELGMARVVVLGFCLGGRYALALAARDRRLTGVVSFYPSIETPRLSGQEWDVVAEAADIRCPVHMITPGNDHLTSRAVFEALQGNLQSRPVPTSIQFFPEAEHAFMQVERRHGTANEQARALSKASSLGFLNAVLRVSASS